MREGGVAQGDPLVSLLDMPRPFAQLKALDLEALVASAVERLGA